MRSLHSLLPAVLLAFGACSSSASAPEGLPEVVGEEVRYEVDGVACTGYLAYDKSRSGARPGVLIVHEWWGHNDYVRRRAEQLAAAGYTAFALDMYGDGKHADHPADAGRFATEVMQNMPAGVARFDAARRILEQHASSDPQRTAAIGYCFGGAIVLAMARRGADLDAVASFHGTLATAEPAQPGAVKARVLVCHGADDVLIPAASVEQFQREMKDAGADLEFVAYPGAKHGFTNPEATGKGQQFGLPLAYDAAADAASWQKLLALLQETWR